MWVQTVLPWLQVTIVTCFLSTDGLFMPILRVKFETNDQYAWAISIQLTSMLLKCLSSNFPFSYYVLITFEMEKKEHNAWNMWSFETIWIYISRWGGSCRKNHLLGTTFEINKFIFIGLRAIYSHWTFIANRVKTYVTMTTLEKKKST